jgi:hypothetical protein
LTRPHTNNFSSSMQKMIAKISSEALVPAYNGLTPIKNYSKSRVSM